MMTPEEKFATFRRGRVQGNRFVRPEHEMYRFRSGNWGKIAPLPFAKQQRGTTVLIHRTFSMFLFRTILLCILGTLLTAGHLPAQSAGSGTAADEYFRGYILKGEAERAEQSGDTNMALTKFRLASEIFDSIAKNYPVWESQMLSYRRQKVKEALTRLEAKGSAASAASSSPAPAENSPAPAGAPASKPSPTPSTPAPGLLPQPGTGNPSASNLPSLSDFLQRYEQTYKQTVDDLTRKNQQYEADLKKWSDWYSWASGEMKASKETTNALATRSAQLEQAVVNMQKEVEAGRASSGELKSLKAQQAQAVAQLSQAQQKFVAAESAAKEANEKLMAATGKIAETSETLAKAQAERDAAIKERDEAMKKTDAATKDRDKLAAEGLGMKTELDSLRRSLAENSNKALLAKNAELKKELDAAKAQIETLKSDLTKKDAEIGQLKGQISTLQGELTSLRQQSATYQKQVSELTLQLKEVQGEMAKSTPESPEMQAENQMLRGIILRQLRNQARQQAAKDAVIAELKKTENASKALLEQVEELSSTRISLTADEQKLFTDPQLKEALSTSGFQATLMAESDTGTPAPKPTDAGSPPLPSATKPDTTEDLLSRGNVALQSDDLTAATSFYEEVLRADPKNVAALIGLGSAKMRAGKYADAEIALKKCLTYDADNETALFNMGINYFSQQKFKESMTYFERGLEKQPKNSRGHHYLGIIATRMGLLDRAEREFKAVLAIDPTYGDAHFNLAVLYISWDPPKWDQARTHYADALKKGVKPDAGLEKILSGATVSAR